MVKRRKRKLPQPPAGCAIGDCMRLIAGAWTAHVLWYLRAGESCFTELHHDIPGISAKMLTSRLRKLERAGAVERSTRATSPPTVWYALTPTGVELAGAVAQVIEVAQKLKSNQQGR
ncbi:MAG: helix-turn-helix transcriptional regulator [Bryobacterales bacterium]|nr:helix-turn-helix transcriptional regulator [Bryobacterales bacterium]